VVVAVLPLVFAVVGVYVLASSGKVAKIGRVVFAVGFFWLVSGLAGAVLHLGTSYVSR
jgi:hypothetical protein